MKIRISTVAAIALFAIAPLTYSGAQATTTSTPCVDGTTSTAVGKGACSGHGGVKSASKTKSDSKVAPTKTKSDSKTAPAKTKSDTTKKAAPTKTKSASKTKAATKAKADTSKPTAKTKPPTVATTSDKDAKDATAQCKDGTYSHAATHTGACSAHGGVDKFLK